MRRGPSVVHMVASVLLLFLCWTIAFYITKAIYTQIGWEPHELVGFIINSSLGFFIFGLGISIAGKFIRVKEHYFHTEVVEALRRISRGDFRVNIDLGFGERKGKQWHKHPYAQLVDNINEMAGKLKEMEELRQEFISNVSHEIGSPLTSISGFARALKDDHLNPEIRSKYLNIIETECVRLSKLSDNLLKLAVLDSSQQPVHPQPYRLDKQIIALILACEPQWEAKRIDMCAETLELEVHADEDLMSQVWMNLIYNSIKFTPQGGRIQISLAQSEAYAVFRISDTGPGIPEHEQPRIFERFYKVDQSRTRTVGGSGLGLSIAHKIIELHHGSISVRSNPGEGAEFTVSLPMMAHVEPGFRTA